MHTHTHIHTRTRTQHTHTHTHPRSKGARVNQRFTYNYELPTPILPVRVQSPRTASAAGPAFGLTPNNEETISAV